MAVSASPTDTEARARAAAADEDLPPVTPVVVEGSVNRASMIGLIMQILFALSALCTLLGLGEQSFLRRLVTFMRGEEGAPIVTLVAMIALAGVQWWRTRKRSVKLSFMGAILPNRFAQVRGTLHPKVQAAAEQAITTLQRRSQ